ncbi:MAG: ribosome silencing factor [Wenzhouxiangella sp.]|jgi:ribosome-associated protein|nr:ribosome silencing factor [Wenzhouxiangella sp.]
MKRRAQKGKLQFDVNFYQPPSLKPHSDPDSRQLCDLAVASLEDSKGEAIQVIDLTDRSTFADYMIVASGNSTRQVKAMADRLVQRAKAAGHAPLGVEGDREAEWVLVDLADVVVHLMLPQTRAFYNLEKLWSTALPARPSSAQA